MVDNYNTDIYDAVRDLTDAIKQLLQTLAPSNTEQEIKKPLTPEEAADFLSVPLGTLRYWQTVKKIEPMLGLSTKHPRYEKEYLLKILKAGFVNDEMIDTREKLNKKRRKRF